MKYLMYYENGFIKKFPLIKDHITVGWDDGNDLVVKDDLVSGYHLKAICDGKKIRIIDLDSTNGTFYKGGKVKEAVVSSNESFTIGSRRLILKRPCRSVQ